MTVNTDGAHDRSAWGRWSTSASALVTYRHLGCRSESIDAEHATGRMTIRSDMRWRHGLLGTPLAVAMLDTAGISIDGVRFGALSHVSLAVHDGGAEVAAVRIDGTVDRMAKRLIFTSATIRDGADPARVVATGRADWVSLGEVGPGWCYLDPGPGVPDRPPMPSLAEAYHVVASAGCYEIPTLGPEVGDEILHHGPQMAALEWQAMDVVDEHAGARLASFDVRFLRGGTDAPFRTIVGECGGGEGEAWVAVDLVDRAGAVVSQAAITNRT